MNSKDQVLNYDNSIIEKPSSCSLIEYPKNKLLEMNPAQSVIALPIQYQQSPNPNNNIFIDLLPMIYSDNPLITLSTAFKAKIIQYLEISDSVKLCEAPNRYNIFSIDDAGIQTHLFKCKEDTSLFSKYMYSQNNRPFHMNIKHLKSQDDLSNQFTQNYMELNKPSSCNNCCNTPVLTAILKENGTNVGLIREPSCCKGCCNCKIVLAVYNNDHDITWNITTSCCQCGLTSKGCCCQNKEICFEIYAANDTTMVNKEGFITKKLNGYYDVTFPSNATPADKLMLINSALYIDYRFYEQKDFNLSVID